MSVCTLGATMPLNHYVTLGRSGLRVSPFCLGAMTFGEDWGWGSSVAESEAILARFLERGGNFIDTANVYTKGHSEKIIGDHIGRDRARRDRAVHRDQVLRQPLPGDPNGGGAGRKSIVAACEQSLRRLQTDYIDLYWMHSWDKFTPIDETMRALDDLVRAGKVRYVGFSDTPAWKVAQAQTIAQFRGWTPLIALQIEYSLIERTVEGELMPMALELGLGVTPWSPLQRRAVGQVHAREREDGQGRSRRARHAVPRRAHVRDRRRAGAHRRAAQFTRGVALAWCRAGPASPPPSSARRRLDQLEQNLRAGRRLTPEEIASLDALSRPALNFPANFLKSANMFMHAGATVNGENRSSGRCCRRTDAERTIRHKSGQRDDAVPQVAETQVLVTVCWLLS